MLKLDTALLLGVVIKSDQVGRYSDLDVNRCLTSLSPRVGTGFSNLKAGYYLVASAESSGPD